MLISSEMETKRKKMRSKVGDFRNLINGKEMKKYVSSILS